MSTAARAIITLYCLLVAACSDGPDRFADLRESIRDLRYCEIAFFYLEPGGITSQTDNSCC